MNPLLDNKYVTFLIDGTKENYDNLFFPLTQQGVRASWIPIKNLGFKIVGNQNIQRRGHDCCDYLSDEPLEDGINVLDDIYWNKLKSININGPTGSTEVLGKIKSLKQGQWLIVNLKQISKEDAIKIFSTGIQNVTVLTINAMHSMLKQCNAIKYVHIEKPKSVNLPYVQPDYTYKKYLEEDQYPLFTSNKTQEVLYIINNTSIGGAETQLLDLLESIDKNIINPTVLVPSGLKGKLFDSYSAICKVICKEMPEEEILEIINSGKYDIVHLITYRSLWDLINHINPRIKVFVSLFFEAKTDKVSLKKFFDENKNLVKAITWITDSHTNNKVFPFFRVIPFGLDTNLFKSLPKKKNSIACVMRISPSKNYEKIFKVAKKLKEYSFDFILATDDPSFEYPNFSNTKIHLNLPRKEVAAILGKSQLFISLSATESLSVAMMEAMSCSCIPVVTSVGDNKNVIKDGKNGYLIPSTNLASKDNKEVDWLINSIPILNKSVLIGNRAREHVKKHYNKDIQIKNMENLYEDTSFGKKTICFIVSNSCIGGVEKIILDILKMLNNEPNKERYYIYTVVTEIKGKYHSLYEQYSNKCYYINDVKILTKFLESYTFDIVHILNSMLGMQLLKKMNAKKTIMSIFGDYSWQGMWFEQRIERFIKNIEYIDIITTDNPKNVTLFKEFPLYIPNGVNIPKKKYIKNFAEPIILWIGRLSGEKRLEILYNTAKSCPNYQFYVAISILVSDSSITDLDQLPNVTIFKNANEKTIKALCEKSLIILNTSLCEGTPISLLEAMAHGCFPVVSNVGNIGNIVGDVGIKIDSLKELNYSKYVEKALEIYKNKPSIYDEITDRINKTHNIDVFYKSIMDIYEDKLNAGDKTKILKLAGKITLVELKDRVKDFLSDEPWLIKSNIEFATKFYKTLFDVDLDSNPYWKKIIERGYSRKYFVHYLLKNAEKLYPEHFDTISCFYNELTSKLGCYSDDDITYVPDASIGILP